jgi:hypothetical protein
MKKFHVIMIVLTVILCGYTAYAAEDDDVPYLSDDDIAALELTLPEDTPEPARRGEAPAQTAADTKRKAATTPAAPAINDLSRLNVSQPLYHLLVVDRTHCALNSDISGIEAKSFLYKFKHGKNGYLIAVYRVQNGGPVFPVLPKNSDIMVDIMTNRQATISEYVDSSVFRRFVTSRKILAQMKAALKAKR